MGREYSVTRHGTRVSDPQIVEGFLVNNIRVFCGPISTVESLPNNAEETQLGNTVRLLVQA
jgi:hypothetical protein